MRLLKIFIILFFTSFIGKGQEKSPYQISTRVFSVKKIGNKFEIDKMEFFNKHYYNEDGTKRSREEFEVTRIPEIINYDDHGNIIERNKFGSDGSLIYRFLYTYDNFNRIIEFRWEDEQCNLITRNEFEYDKEGNKIKSEQFEDDSISLLKTIYYYDTINNQTKFTEYKKGKIHEIYTHKYDCNNNLIEIQWLDTLGQCNNKTVFEYNDNSDLLKECTFDKNHNIIIKNTFDYAFDKYGSWIEKRQYVNDSLTQITKREIKYYE